MILCTTCPDALHRGTIELKAKHGRSFKAEAVMNIMRWTALARLKAAHKELEIQHAYGSVTKQTRIDLGLEKTPHTDSFCRAGNLRAQRLDCFLSQKQTRRHNRQIHKMTICKGGLSQAQSGSLRGLWAPAF